MTPAAFESSNVSRRSRSSGVTNDPAAPPSRIAFRCFPPRTPPARSSSSRRVIPCSTSYTPGASTQPERQNRRGPVESGVPILAYSEPPSVSTSSTFTSVSTLLIPVGLPKTPRSTGNGGLLRGSPRLPSIELNSEVSSPQMYAPAPRRSSTSNANPSPITSVPRNPRAYAWSIARSSIEVASGYSPRM